MADGRESDVWVVILNWNGGSMLLDTVESVLAMDAPVPHVLVVDNASQDGSEQAVRARFPEVEVIDNAANLGFAAGNNVGIRAALAQGAAFVLLLNNDTRVDPAAVNRLRAALLADPRRGMAAPKIYYAGEARPLRLWAAGGAWRAFPPRAVMRGLGQLDAGQYDCGEVVPYATGCALLIRRELFETCGLLDEHYFMYQEDYAFCDRVRAQGLQIWYEPGAVIQHRVSASTGEGSPAKLRYWGYGTVLFYAQHYQNRVAFVGALAAFLAWAVVRDGVRGRRIPFKALAQGVREGWAALGDI
jgi:GT2 family glycosyltransferase